MDDYAKAILSPASYKKLLEARAKDFDAIHERLSEAKVLAEERRRRATNGEGDGGREWRDELDLWALKQRGREKP